MSTLKKMKFLKNLKEWVTISSKKQKQEDVEEKENIVSSV